MICTATGEQGSSRMLLCIVAVVIALSIGAAARSDWSYSLAEGTSHSITLVGMFYVSSGGSARGLDVVMTNSTDSLLTILWDESAMVLPDGQSARVIHTGVRIIDKAAPQAPTAIAPNSRATEAVWPASHVTTSEYFPTQSVRLWNNCTISLYLTIQDNTGKHTEHWKWVFTERVVPAAPRREVRINWWLWGGIILGLALLGWLVGPQAYE